MTRYHTKGNWLILMAGAIALAILLVGSLGGCSDEPTPPIPLGEAEFKLLKLQAQYKAGIKKCDSLFPLPEGLDPDVPVKLQLSEEEQEELVKTMLKRAECYRELP